MKTVTNLVLVIRTGVIIALALLLSAATQARAVSDDVIEQHI